MNRESEYTDGRPSRSRSRSKSIICSGRRGPRLLRTPERHATRLSRIECDVRRDRPPNTRSRSRSLLRTTRHLEVRDTDIPVEIARPSRVDQGRRDSGHSRSRSRTRSRSRRRRMREREEEYEIQAQRLAVLKSQLEHGKTSRRDEKSHQPQQRSEKNSREKTRYDSASILLEQFLKAIQDRPSERESFPSHLNNVVPEFNPLMKEQTVDMWLSKVDECSEIYQWTDKQTVHYALPKLSGHAKSWYQGLPSLKRTWLEWKELLKSSFPSNENYAELLSEMLRKRSRFGESLEIYYYAKINLLNRCKIFGQNAVDCLIHGVDDRGVRVGAQAAKFEKPEDVLKFFKTVRDNYDRRDKPSRQILNLTPRPKNDEPPSSLPKTGQAQQNNIMCFNCKQKGHPSFKCPKPLLKCSSCNLMGHTESECRRKSTRDLDPNTKTVLKVLVHDSKVRSDQFTNQKNIGDVATHDNTSSKYIMPIQINNQTTLSIVDLGSEATLVRSSDAVKLGLKWEPVDGPFLRGLGNVPYLPKGETYATVEVQGLVERDIQIFIVEDGLINYPVLLGHSFSERPNVRIVKTTSELTFERVQERDVKIQLVTLCDVTIQEGEFRAVRVKCDNVNDCNIYVAGSVRGQPDSQYYLLPGEYKLSNSECCLLVHGLGARPVHFREGTLVTRASVVDAGLKVNIVAEDPEWKTPRVNCGDHISPQDKLRLEDLLSKFKECFSSGMHDLGFTTETEMVIQLKDSDPVVYRPYRLSFSQRKKVQAMINELLECGIVQESNSPYASPIVLVQKKTGDMRLCVDYRALNNKTRRDHYPLPRIEDLLDRLSGQIIFTTLDLASGYHQIPIAKDSIEKTAFVTPDGQYEYTRMPFGLANAPAVFQRLIHKVLNKFKIKHAIVYMDDILIPASSVDEGFARLEEVLLALKNCGLTLKMEKCHFFKESIDFLGFEITKGEIKPGSRKTQAIACFEAPTNQHEVRRFLGLASFFRRFVKDFASKARPLTNLLKKDTPWRWTEEEAFAFQSLKQSLTDRPILALYDHTAETQLHTDASRIGVAGILLQRKGCLPFRPIAYFSRQTTPDEQKLHSFELETLAVVSSLQKFRVYLLGIKFTIFSDCHALRSTFTKRDLVPRISRWWIQFLEFDCTIEYRPGDKMAHVDCLSRKPVEIGNDDVHTLDILTIKAEDWITTVQSGDTEVKRIKEILEDPETAKVASICKEYRVKNGRVFKVIDDKTERWVVPRNVRWQLLKANHDDVGHFGFSKTLERIRSFYWFPRMRKFVKKYVSSCLGCAHHKLPSGAKEGELHSIPKIEIPFHTVHADHLGPFIRSRKKNSYILVIVDSFTKYIHLAPVRSTKSKASIKVFQNYFSLFGVPTRLITDRGTSFTSKKFKSFVQSLGIKHVLNSVATPRANGQVERYNRTILSALGATSHDKGPEVWDQHLPEIQIGINTSVHEVTKRTPTELLFGRKVPSPSQGILNRVVEDVGNGSTDKNLDDIRNDAREAIQQNQDKNKKLFDQRRKRVTKYHVGDLVRIVRAVPSNTGQSKKLEPKCQGPYKIKKILPHDRFVVVDTPLTRKGRRYEGVLSADKIFPWMSYGAVYSSSESSDEE